MTALPAAPRAPGDFAAATAAAPYHFKSRAHASTPETRESLAWGVGVADATCPALASCSMIRSYGHTQHACWHHDTAAAAGAACDGPAAAAAGHLPSAPDAAAVLQLPLDLLAGVLRLVLDDDAAQERRPVVQFVGRQWLAAYRCVAYSRVSLHVGATLASLQQRHSLLPSGAEAALLQALAVRLPYAAEVDVRGVPPPVVPGPVAGAAAGHSACQLRWLLGELLGACLAGSSRLRRLSVDWLPHHLPQLLHLRAAGQRWGGHTPAPLAAMELHAVPAEEVLRHAELLQRLPLCVLGVADAARLSDAEAAALAGCLPAFSHLTSLSLGGSRSAPACPVGEHGPTCQHVHGPGVHFSSGAAGALCAAAQMVHAAAGAAAAPPARAPEPAAGARHDGTSLPSLQLVAAAAGLPGLQQLELSLTFGRGISEGQHSYLDRLGAVLHSQRQRGSGAAASGSHVSVRVHEHLQGDLSAVPVASCSLELDWDSESNPIEVWQCSTLSELRIAAQLPLQAGHFRPARLAALQTLQVVGCCHIPSYFAAALCSMQQLSRLELTDCLPEAVAALPWQIVLPLLPALQDLAIERCPGAAGLPGLWLGLTGTRQLRRLRITGSCPSGGLPSPTLAQPQQQHHHQLAAGADNMPEELLRGAAHDPGLWQGPVGGAAAGAASLQPGAAQVWWAGHAAPPSPAACTIPECVAVLRHLRCLDLSCNGLRGMPDALAWCQQLVEVQLAGNRLRSVPRGVAALSSLRKLDLSANQLEAVCNGPYLSHLEELSLGANLPLGPSGLPGELLATRRLRRLGLPLWWLLTGGAHDAPERLLLRAMPWLLLERS